MIAAALAGGFPPPPGPPCPALVTAGDATPEGPRPPSARQPQVSRLSSSSCSCSGGAPCTASHRASVLGEVRRGRASPAPRRPAQPCLDAREILSDWPRRNGGGAVRYSALRPPPGETAERAKPACCGLSRPKAAGGFYREGRSVTRSSATYLRPHGQVSMHRNPLREKEQSP